MESQNPQKMNEQEPLSGAQQLRVALPLKNDKLGTQRLSVRLYQEFQAAKTYGKDPEALESMIPLFTTALADFPIEKIEKAFDTFSQRSDEFPTRFDIITIIKRNGRPPIKESDIIAINKKDGSDRTPADWQMLREWNAQQSEEWDDDTSTRDTNLQRDNESLRRKISALEQENKKLADLLHETKMEKGLEKPKPSMQEKIDNTVKAMRDGGASEADIEEFMSQYAA